MKKKILYLLALLTPFCVHADEELDRLMSMSLEELLKVDITSSTHTRENLFTVPSSVTIFTYEQIHAMSVNSLEELMNYVPGFQSNRAATYTNQYETHTRGGVSEGGVLVLYDGQRLNMDWSGSVTSRNHIMSLENVEKIEFIKGPGSALYGSNAFVGVINITTKKDLRNLGLRANDKYQNAYMNYAYDEDDLRISSFVKGFDDDGVEYNEALDSYTGTLRKPKDENSGSEAYVNAQYKDFSVQARYIQRISEQWYALGFNSDISDATVNQKYLRLGYSFANLDAFKSKIDVSYIQARGDVDFSLSTGLYANTVVDEDSYGVQWENTYLFNDEHNLNFGAEFRQANIKEANLKLSTASRADIADMDSREIYSLYGQYQGSYSDLKLTLGLRYDKYSDFGSTFNPRTALVYHAFEKTSFKLLYGSAFKAPTQQQLYLKNNTVSSGNPDLNPEKIQTYEAIIIQNFFSNSFSLSYFKSYIEDTIERSFEGTLLTFKNTDEQKYAGIEAELISDFLDNDLNTRLSISHITDSDQDIIITPKTTLSAIANYRYNNFNFNLAGFYHSSTENEYASEIKTLDSYILLNTKLRYTFSPELMMYIDVQNITDEDYLTPSIVGSPAFDVENRGRLVYLGIEYKF